MRSPVEGIGVGRSPAEKTSAVGAPAEGASAVGTPVERVGEVGPSAEGVSAVRTLIVLRHAKAAQVPGLPDQDRPLTDRGERDAKRAGEEIRTLGLVPDLVLCSPAQRIRRTAELAFPAVETDYERMIYQAWAEEILELIRRLDPEHRTVVLCGHNPGALDLALLLTGGDYGFRPGAFAVIRIESEWTELGPGGGALVTVWDPRDD